MTCIQLHSKRKEEKMAVTITATSVKKFAANVATIAASIGAVLAVLLNTATTLHAPANEITIIVAAGSIVAAIGLAAKDVASVKLAARKAAKTGKHVAP